MLVEFSCKNWMSFKDEMKFSMVASDDESHQQRLSDTKCFDQRVLPISAIYGGNASGKTNFFEAISFAKEFITRGKSSRKSIPVLPFRLERWSAPRPTRFSFTIVVEERMFVYIFEVTSRKVVSEKLIERTVEDEVIHYSRDLKKGISINKSAGREETQFFDVLRRVIPADHLVLTDLIYFERQVFRPVYDWFDKCLELVSPDAEPSRVTHPYPVKASLPNRVSDMISLLDTGISKIRFEEVDEDDLDWTKDYLSYVESALRSKDVCVVVPSKAGIRDENFHAARKDRKIAWYRWVPCHKRKDGSIVKFESRHESAGTRRLLALLPILFPVFSSKSAKVYVIDELDRSLHTNLSKELIGSFLRGRKPENRNQMIITTHDSALMNNFFFRRDELWLTTRKDDGSSQMLSVHDFVEEEDNEDIRARYLSGKYGGIPRVLLRRMDFVGNGDSDEQRQER